MEPWYATGARRTLDDEDGKAQPFFSESLKTLFSRPDWISNLTPKNLRADALAGLTGATLVLPQGVAFAAIAGLPPEYGFYSAMVPPIVAALTGSSWQSVSGPTTAISLLVFAGLSGAYVPGSPAFIAAAITLAFLVGIFQLALGLVRLGGIVDFVSHSVMTGFVAGAALLIGFSQLSDALHIALPHLEQPIEFFSALAHNLADSDWRSGLIAGAAIAVGFTIQRLRPLLPSYLIALIVATLISVLLGGAEAGLKTVGAIKSVVPEFAVPGLSFGLVRDLMPSAVAIAIVGLLEAISVARALASKSGQAIDGNREFAGQGASNLIGSFFHCYPSSASFTRSGINYESGAKTPLSSVFGAVFLLLILLLVAPLFSVVPVAGMAGVIILVAWRLIDWRELRHIVTTSRSETAIAGVTMGSTLFVGLEFAVYTGVMMSLVLFAWRVARPILGVSAPDPSTANRVFRSARLYNLEECPQLIFSSLDGPLYFGTVEAVRREFRRYRAERPSQKHFLFMMSGGAELDLPAVELLIEEARVRQKIGGALHLKVMNLRTIDTLRRFRALPILGRNNLFLSKRDAIAAIVPQLDQEICAACRVRVFRECPEAAEEQPAGSS
jgi:SulP family sulfate permease